MEAALKIEVRGINGLAGGQLDYPGPIEDYVLDDGNVKESIKNIREELLSDNPDKKKITTNQHVLLKFGFKLAAWTKERITEFATAASVSAGTGFGL